MIRRVYYAYCGECANRPSTPAQTRTEAAYIARQDGWCEYTPGRSTKRDWICPSCIEAKGGEGAVGVVGHKKTR